MVPDWMVGHGEFIVEPINDVSIESCSSQPASSIRAPYAEWLRVWSHSETAQPLVAGDISKCRAAAAKFADSTTLANTAIATKRSKCEPQLIPLLGPGPNTDPGLPGETGVSGDSGTVYGIDGLKVGAGIDGAPSSSGGPERPRIAPGAWPPAPPPRAWACPAANAPNKATHAARANVVSAIRSILLLRICDLH